MSLRQLLLAMRFRRRWQGDVARIEGGVVKWKVNAGVPLSGGVGSDGRRVVVGSPKGDILAFDASDGKELWKTRVTSEVLAAPAVDGKLVVVRSGDNRLFAFDPNDGKRKWVYQRQTPPLSLRSFAAPLIDNNYVFVGFPGGKLVAVTVNNGAPAGRCRCRSQGDNRTRPGGRHYRRTGAGWPHDLCGSLSGTCRLF